MSGSTRGFETELLPDSGAELALASRTAVGVDVGGTNIRAGLVAGNGAVLASVRRPLLSKDPEAVLAQLEGLLRDGFPMPHREALDNAPLGVGLAAQVRSDTGVVAVSPNLGWHDVPFGDMLRERFQRPVRLINDLNAITVGEARAGAARGAPDVVCIFVGTGVGMGAMVDGHLLEGADGLAAELGHIKVASPDRSSLGLAYWGSEGGSEGRPCGCGARGCLEAYTGGRYLPELIAEQVASGLTSRLLTPESRDLSRIHAASVEAAATAGDPAARAVWARAAELLGHAIGTVVTLFNPRVLVLGGGVLRAAPSLLAAVRARAVPYVGEPYARGLQISESALGDDAGVVGAALAVV